jgi:drug/metabolite transporter (DMT)-like permease
MMMQSKRLLAEVMSFAEIVVCRGDCRKGDDWTKGRQNVKTGPMNDPLDKSHAAQSRNARLMVLAAAVLWSTSGFFVKAPYLAGWPGPALAFWRAAFACVVLWPLVRRPQWSWKLIPTTATFVAMNYSYLTAMASASEGSAANAIWLQFTAPVWVLIVGVFVFGERAGWRDWLLIAFAAVGVAVILHYESRGEALDAVLWGLASGLFYAGVVLSLRQLRHLESAWLVALNHLVTAIVLAPFALAGSHFPSGVQWLLLGGLGIVQMGLPYILFARGLKHIPGHEATGIGLAEPLLVPVWVYLAWGDKPAWWTLVGGGLILIGLAIRYFAPTLKAPPEAEPSPPLAPG